MREVEGEAEGHGMTGTIHHLPSAAWHLPVTPLHQLYDSSTPLPHTWPHTRILTSLLPHFLPSQRASCLTSWTSMVRR